MLDHVLSICFPDFIVVVVAAAVERCRFAGLSEGAMGGRKRGFSREDSVLIATKSYCDACCTRFIYLYLLKHGGFSMVF